MTITEAKALRKRLDEMEAAKYELLQQLKACPHSWGEPISCYPDRGYFKRCRVCGTEVDC